MKYIILFFLVAFTFIEGFGAGMAMPNKQCRHFQDAYKKHTQANNVRFARIDQLHINTYCN